MTPKEALNGLANFIIMHGNNDDYDASAIEWHVIIKQALNELERLKKFKETLYENWLECEKEFEELKRDVARYFYLENLTDDKHTLEVAIEHHALKEKLSKVGNEE